MSSRFFVPGKHAPGDTIELTGGDARKIATVLRKKSGDTIEVIDSASQRFRSSLRLENHRVRARLDELVIGDATAERYRIDVAQAIPKGQKMDFVVEKLTELGTAHILPVYSERTVIEEIGSGKLERWRRLVKTAAQQCGRTTIPVVSDPQPLAGLIRVFGTYDLVLFPWELADAVPLRETLPGLVETARSILVVIGPEGGFSSDEAAAARDAGAHLVSLGTRILRTETAALVVMALLNYLS